VPTKTEPDTSTDTHTSTATATATATAPLATVPEALPGMTWFSFGPMVLAEPLMVFSLLAVGTRAERPVSGRLSGTPSSRM
jgi:hypothetical protein